MEDYSDSMDDGAFPDINNEEPQSSFNTDDFKILPKPVSMIINELSLESVYISHFLESGGVIKEMLPPKWTKSYFVAYRQSKIKGYGDTPLQAITMWSLKTSVSDL
jgi:hypothetical protein